VAFVGRRHFDDPYLLEQIFEYQPPRLLRANRPSIR